MSATPVAEPSVPAENTRAGRARRLFSSSVISFSLTFVGVSLAVLAGYLPAQQALLSGRIDPEVVLLFVPLCALVFAIVAEAVRISFKAPLRSSAARRGSPLADWRPGHGEG